MEKIEEIKTKIRKQIREILLSDDELIDYQLVKKKMDFNELKKDSYIKLVDLKNDFESDYEKPKEDTIKKINELTTTLSKLKAFLGNQL